MSGKSVIPLEIDAEFSPDLAVVKAVRVDQFDPIEKLITVMLLMAFIGIAIPLDSRSSGGGVMDRREFAVVIVVPFDREVDLLAEKGAGSHGSTL